MRFSIKRLIVSHNLATVSVLSIQLQKKKDKCFFKEVYNHKIRSYFIPLGLYGNFYKSLCISFIKNAKKNKILHCSDKGINA